MKKKALSFLFVVLPQLVLLILGPSGALGGVNGDGKVDILFANANSAEFNRVCLGDGTGGFTCSDVGEEIRIVSQVVAVGDVNADGKLDALFGGTGTIACTPNPGGGLTCVEAQNIVCLGDGAGGFACSNISTDVRDRGALGIALGDVNKDGKLDAVFANPNTSPRSKRVCLGDGAGGFVCSDLSADGRSSTGVGLADVNGDGNLDAVFADFDANNNQVCIGNGAGSFACSDLTGTARRTGGVALGDVNGDGHVDAVFGVFLGLAQVCLGNGAGAFACSDVSPELTNSGRVALGHVNGDGNLDAIFAARPRNVVCLGDGAGGFACTDVPGELAANDLALGDVNRDGNLDAVFAIFKDTQNVLVTNRVCLGNGAGAFACSDVSTDRKGSVGVALAFTPFVTPEQAIQNLVDDISGLGLPGGVRTSLTGPLNQVVDILNDNNPNNDAAACGKLGAFVNQVNAQEKSGNLTAGQADGLRQSAEAIQASLGCP